MMNLLLQVTWEWTIGRDFRDRVADTAAYALHTVLRNGDSTDGSALVYAMYLLESAIVLDSDGLHSGRMDQFPATTLLKNAGLAHVHLVQSKTISSDRPLTLPGPDVFATLDRIGWPKDAGYVYSFSGRHAVGKTL
jgi:hypothetical protein